LRSKKKLCSITYRWEALIVTLLLFSILTPAQFIAAFIANSLALLGDCASLTVDTASYAFNLWAECIDSKHKERNQFMATALSILILLGITGYVIYESLDVFFGGQVSDEDVNQYIIFGFSIAGLLFDAIALWVLAKAKKEKSATSAGDLNLLSAILHVFADLMRSLTTLVESVLIWCFDYDSSLVDAWAALIVCALILIPCVALIRQCIIEYVKYLNADREAIPLLTDDGNQKRRISHGVIYV